MVSDAHPKEAAAIGCEGNVGILPVEGYLGAKRVGEDSTCEKRS